MNENQMTYQSAEEEEIDLKALLFTLLHKLKPILLTAVVCAVLAGGFGLAKNAYSSYAAQKTESSEDGTVVKSAAEKKYDEDMQAYRREKTTHDDNIRNYQNSLQQNKRSIETTNVQIENAEEYQNNSVLQSLDPYNVHIAQVSMYVATDYKIMPGMDYQNVNYTNAVLTAYTSMMTNREIMTDIAGSLGMEERYLRELVSVSSDTSTQMLSIRAYGTDDEMANKIVDALLDRMNDVEQTIQSAVGSHTIRELARTTSVSVLTNLRDSQQENRDSLTQMQDQITSLEESNRMLNQKIEDEQQALDAMELPEEPATAGTSLVKLIVIGILVGGVLACGVVVVKFLVSDGVYSASELNRSTGLPVLGALASERSKKADKLDAKLNQMEGRPDGSADAEMLCLMAQTIRSRMPEAEKVLITGDLPTDQLEALAAALQATDALRTRKVVAAESILKAAATVQQVVMADAIVLAVDCTCSKTGAVREEIEKISRLDKKVLGCIVYE